MKAARRRKTQKAADNCDYTLDPQYYPVYFDEITQLTNLAKDAGLGGRHVVIGHDGGGATPMPSSASAIAAPQSALGAEPALGKNAKFNKNWDGVADLKTQQRRRRP